MDSIRSVVYCASKYIKHTSCLPLRPSIEWMAKLKKHGIMIFSVFSVRNILKLRLLLSIISIWKQWLIYVIVVCYVC